MSSTEQRQQLAYVILVEPLAYQFASPVRWIETQDILFTLHDFERFIEIGPSPTLTGMASRTLKAKYEAGDDSVSRTRAILCHANHTKEVYYQFDGEVAAEPVTVSNPTPTVAVQTPVEILKGLLSGRAHIVIANTSRDSRVTVIFQQHGSNGSALTVVPLHGW